MKPIFTSLTPNAQKDDIWMNLIILTAPHYWRTGAGVAEIEHAFRNYLGGEYAFSFDSGRTSLFALLKAIHLEQGSEVLLQAYTCVAVPGPVLWAGLTPVYVDVEKETLNMSAQDLEKKITPRSKVLIIQHTFGFPADLDRLLEVAKKHNLFVIEDCAHALGATYKGKRVGTFGDAAFFSLGRDKSISSTFGGVVIVKSKELAVNLRHIERSLKPPRSAWVAKQLFHPIIMGTVKGTYNFLMLGKLIMRASRSLRVASRAVYPAEKRGGKPPFAFHRLANGLALAAVRQFKKIDTFNAHRRAIAASYTVGLPEAFTTGSQKALPESEPSYLRFTVRHPRAPEILAEAKKENIFLGDWYTTAIAPAGVDYEAIQYDPNSCPNAEAAAKETFNLPTDIHITENDAKRIINFLASFSENPSSKSQEPNKA